MSLESAPYEWQLQTLSNAYINITCHKKLFKIDKHNNKWTYINKCLKKKTSV